MTEEPENNVLTSPEKLLIDNLSDFRFHAAYLAYSDAYDKANDVETKKHLNQNITALQQNQIEYSTFYANISQYRMTDRFQHLYSRSLIKTQKKKDWRRETQRQERNKRHRK